MANISAQHVKPVTSGFVGLLVLAALGIGVLNHFANKR
jgi:hypothetical protein